MKKLLACLIGLLFLSSCFALPVEEPVLPPPVIEIPDAVEYKLVPVIRGDVIHQLKPAAMFVPIREVKLSFVQSNIFIKGIYVSVGDHVYEGDILAELELPHIQTELEGIEKEEEWVRLSLAQLDARYELSLSQFDITENPVDELSYLEQRNNLLTQWELLDTRIAFLRDEEEKRYLRSPMEGTVSTALTYQSGMRSDARRTLVTVEDQSLSVYMVRSRDAEHLSPGDAVTMEVNRDFYQALIINPEDYNISRSTVDNIPEAYMIITDDNPPVQTATTYASVFIVLAESCDVLQVPYAAVKKANDRTFVYLLEDGIRTIRDVEIGLEGNHEIEIKNGLHEGELVIYE